MRLRISKGRPEERAAATPPAVRLAVAAMATSRTPSTNRGAAAAVAAAWDHTRTSWEGLRKLKLVLSGTNSRMHSRPLPRRAAWQEERAAATPPAVRPAVAATATSRMANTSRGAAADKFFHILDNRTSTDRFFHLDAVIFLRPTTIF